MTFSNIYIGMKIAEDAINKSNIGAHIPQNPFGIGGGSSVDGNNYPKPSSPYPDNPSPYPANPSPYPNPSSYPSYPQGNDYYPTPQTHSRGQIRKFRNQDYDQLKME